MALSYHVRSILGLYCYFGCVFTCYIASMFNIILFVQVLLFIVIYIPHFIFKYKALLEIKTQLSLATARVTHAFSVKVFRLLCVKGKTCIAWCSRKGTGFLFNNLFINFAFIYFIIFATSDYITLHPSAWGRELKREYDAFASVLCSYARYSTCFASVVSRPPCHSDTLNSVPHNRCSFPKTVLES